MRKQYNMLNLRLWNQAYRGLNCTFTNSDFLKLNGDNDGTFFVGCLRELNDEMLRKQLV